MDNLPGEHAVKRFFEGVKWRDFLRVRSGGSSVHRNRRGIPRRTVGALYYLFVRARYHEGERISSRRSTLAPARIADKFRVMTKARTQVSPG